MTLKLEANPSDRVRNERAGCARYRPRTLRSASLGLALAVYAFAGLASAQDTEPGSVALRVAIHTTQPVYLPDGGVRLRFELGNTSDAPVMIPIDPALALDGVGLPAELILGTPEQPALQVTYEDEPAVDVLPPQRPTNAAEGAHELKLAPHGFVGTELDLQKHHRAARYPGLYTVQWRPLGGQAGQATVQFRVETRKQAIVVTDYGKLTFTLDYERAPRNVENFLELVRTGFYNGKTFHRIVTGFLIQGGCPKGDGTGQRPDGRTVPAEFTSTPIDVGTLVMARRPNDPNSASCQFFMALSRLAQLDEQYTVIGQATDDESLRTLQQLATVAVDRRDRPVEPVVIRSVNLVDDALGINRRLELGSPASASTPTDASAPTRPRDN